MTFLEKNKLDSHKCIFLPLNYLKKKIESFQFCLSAVSHQLYSIFNYKSLSTLMIMACFQKKKKFFRHVNK